MKKISTLFKKDPNDLGRVTNEVDPLNEWALTEGVITRKYDGTACAIIGGELYKRFDLKKDRTLPEGIKSIPCQEPDEITGHHPHWILCDRNDPSNKYHFEAFDNSPYKQDGTYELCGPKIQGNPEGFESHVLVPHGKEEIDIRRTFINIKSFLEDMDVEGFVFHHPDGRMCKIRKSDFGIKRIKTKQ